MKERLTGQRIRNPEQHLSRTEKLLREAGHTLEFRFVTANDAKSAMRMEAEVLMNYEREY